MPHAQRISALKRQVRRARLERDAAVEASEGYRKKERLYALREKQAELALGRVQAAEKEHSQQERLLAHKGKALMQAQADLTDTQGKCSRYWHLLQRCCPFVKPRDLSIHAKEQK